jgi:hypothetical protein
VTRLGDFSTIGQFFADWAIVSFEYYENNEVAQKLIGLSTVQVMNKF